MVRMPKVAAAKTQFACAECGHSSPKWLGQCPACRQWNTLHEELAPAPTRAGTRGFAGVERGGRAVPLKDVEVSEEALKAAGIGQKFTLQMQFKKQGRDSWEFQAS